MIRSRFILKNRGIADAKTSYRRLFVLLGGGILLTAALSATQHNDMQHFVPGFMLGIFLCFLPAFWSKDSDLAEPPAINGILNGLGLTASFVSCLFAGRVEYSLLPFVPLNERDDLTYRVLSAFFFGTLFYYIGYYSGAGKHLRSYFPQVHGLRWNWGRFLVVTVICVSVFVICYAYFQNKMDSPIYDITQLAKGKNVWRNDPTLTWMQRGILLGFIPALFLFPYLLSRKKNIGVFVTILLLGFVGVLVTRLGQRGTFFLNAMALLIFFHYLQKRVPVTVFIALWFVVIICVSVLGEWRSDPESVGRQRPLIERILHPLESLGEHEADRHRLGALGVAFHVFPKYRDYLWGESWYAILVSPIPRWIWPEKVNMFMWRDTAIISNLTGAPVPMPLIGILYVNFSWGGILVGMALWGLFHRALYEWLLLSLPTRDINVIMLYALILLYFGPSMLQLASAIQYVLPAWLILKFIGSRSRPSTAIA